jgi:hypothetical protein
MTSAPASATRPATEWYDFVSASCEEGRSWVAEYQAPEHAAIPVLTQKALALLRTNQVAEGRDVLSQMEDHLAKTTAAPATILCVLERWLHGVAAYYHYVVEDYDEADASLNRAHAAITAAISGAVFLLPLANHCPEFVLHRARISRSRRRWDDMREDVATARRMTENQIPLCVLSDDSPVDYRRLERFYLSIPALSEEQQVSLTALLDDELRLRRFERFVAGIYALPGFVIPYP